MEDEGVCKVRKRILTGSDLLARYVECPEVLFRITVGDRIGSRRI